MTSAVGSATQQVYAPPASTMVASADLQTEIAPVTAATAPTGPTGTGGPLLSSSTVGAIVTQQSASADAVAEPVETKPRSAYEIYMPTREGFSAYALAIAVENPDAVSSSAGKNDEEVAADARARLDKNYARMKESGQEFSYSSWEGVDWHSLFGDFDPRSLAAVKENRGALFSKQEQIIAESMLHKQDAFRAGAYNGPTRLVGHFMAAGLSKRPSADATEAMKHWDKEAAKNETDVGTQLGRASMRVLLGQAASAELFGDGMSSKDQMMYFLVEVLQKAQADDPGVLDKIGAVRTADDLKKQDWFKDHIQRFDEIVQSMNDKPNADMEPVSA